MITKIYILAWLVSFTAGGSLYLTGNLDAGLSTGLAFAISTLMATGVVAVLPGWLEKHFTWKYQASDLSDPARRP